MKVERTITFILTILILVICAMFIGALAWLFSLVATQIDNYGAQLTATHGAKLLEIQLTAVAP